MKRKFAPVMITAAALITTVPTTQVYEDIIRETNETLVPKEQVLSDHLYIYERSSGTLKTFEQK